MKPLCSISLDDRDRRTKSKYSTVEALVSGHPRNSKKVSETGAGRLLLREWFLKWPLEVQGMDCRLRELAKLTKYRIVTGRGLRQNKH